MKTYYICALATTIYLERHSAKSSQWVTGALYGHALPPSGRSSGYQGSNLNPI